MPNLAADVRFLVAAQAQADPKLQSPLLDARMSARGVREALVSETGYTHSELPTRQTIGERLNRMGYGLKKHKKQNP